MLAESLVASIDWRGEITVGFAAKPAASQQIGVGQQELSLAIVQHRGDFAEIDARQEFLLDAPHEDELHVARLLAEVEFDQPAKQAVAIGRVGIGEPLDKAATATAKEAVAKTAAIGR